MVGSETFSKPEPENHHPEGAPHCDQQASRLQGMTGEGKPTATMAETSATAAVKQVDTILLSILIAPSCKVFLKFCYAARANALRNGASASAFS